MNKFYPLYYDKHQRCMVMINIITWSIKDKVEIIVFYCMRENPPPVLKFISEDKDAAQNFINTNFKLIGTA